MAEHNTPESPVGEVICRYTREQAIADGVLVDVTVTAREAGFRIPVALTAEAWADCVAWANSDSQQQTLQDEAGRLWDVLWMAALAARSAKERERIAFQLYRVPRGQGTRARLATLNLAIGPGDNVEPVITILMPRED